MPSLRLASALLFLSSLAASKTAPDEIVLRASIFERDIDNGEPGFILGVNNTEHPAYKERFPVKQQVGFRISFPNGTVARDVNGNWVDHANFENSTCTANCPSRCESLSDVGIVMATGNATGA
jgi:hypothetical protein